MFTWIPKMPFDSSNFHSYSPKPKFCMLCPGMSALFIFPSENTKIHECKKLYAQACKTTRFYFYFFLMFPVKCLYQG